MNTNYSLSRPAALARPFIAADTTELGRPGRLEHAHSILRDIRVIVVAALLALLSVPSDVRSVFIRVIRGSVFVPLYAW